jgi:hypothetical protein
MMVGFGHMADLTSGSHMREDRGQVVGRWMPARCVLDGIMAPGDNAARAVQYPAREATGRVATPRLTYVSFALPPPPLPSSTPGRRIVNPSADKERIVGANCQPPFVWYEISPGKLSLVSYLWRTNRIEPPTPASTKKGLLGPTANPPSLGTWGPQGGLIE